MKMLLNNGTVINNAPVVSEKTKKYLSQFWQIPSEEEISKKKEKYYIVDYKRDWQRKEIFREYEFNI